MIWARRDTSAERSSDYQGTDMSREPVIVGVAQVANKDPERIVHPVALLEDAARAAFADAGADPTGHIGAVYSAPLSVFSEEHGGAMVAARLGLPDGIREQSNYSGAGPQRLLAIACDAIARGDIDAALLVGGVADASVRRARERGQDAPAPPTSVWSQGSAGTGSLERLRNRDWPFSAEQGSGAGMPSSYFALVESAMARAAGRMPDAHRASLGDLLAPFTQVAAARPEVAWFPTARTPAEIATVGPDNRFVAEPYTKLMCSFPTVDLAAALVVMSRELADRLGIGADRRVHPLALTLGHEVGPPSVRPDIARAQALTDAASRALEAASVAPDQIEAFDLYSCFPAAVQLGMAAFGIREDDSRPRTTTGGLPYFGGPGAAYTLHGVVSMVERCRANGGRVGAVVGLGGAVDDFSVGLYSADPPAHGCSLETETVYPDATPVEITRTTDGVAVVEACTVMHERDAGPVGAPVIARLPDGSRIGARALDPELAKALSGTSLVGTRVRITSADDKAFYEPV
jgi:acetyl-CoA C-acetyltransferase